MTDDWILSNDYEEPKEFDIVIVISKYAYLPTIAQYRGIGGEMGFLDVSELLTGINNDINEIIETAKYSYYEWHAIECWKPLQLPKRLDANIKQLIEKWVNKNEEEIQ